MIDWLALLLVFFFGAIIGSFVNVIVLRFGFQESPRHRSSCQGCASPLHWFELVPIISFIVLRGRCASCGSSISVQYPMVEIGTAILFTASFIVASPLVSIVDWVLLLLLFSFWAVFIAIVVYDLRHTLVPTLFAFAMMGAALLHRGVAALSLNDWNVFIDGLLGAILLGGIILSIVLITRMRGMGFGDIYIALSMGLLLGWWGGLDALILSFWIGAVVGIALIVLSRFSPLSSLLGMPRHTTIKSEVPFVPFLFLGTLIVVLSDVSSFMLIDVMTAMMF